MNNEREYDLNWLQDPRVFAINRINAHSDHKVDTFSKQQVINLDGEWGFAYAAKPQERDFTIINSNKNINNMDKMMVPGCVELYGYGKCKYLNIMYPWDGTKVMVPPVIDDDFIAMSTYVKEFDMSEQNLTKRHRICFEGVDKAFYLILNGAFIGYSEDCNTPAEFDISNKLQAGKNRIVVLVFAHSSASWLEDQDMWRFSGIFRSVYIYEISKVHIEDVGIKTELIDNYQTGILEVDVKLDINKDELIDDYSVDIQILDAEENAINRENGRIFKDTFSYKLVNTGINTWSAETPYLYKLIITIKDDNDKKIESAALMVGYRKLEMINKVICINGKRIVFRGVNRHEFNYERGRAITKEDMIFDILTMKRNNINAVRTSHYPNQKLWYELCDEYGIYLIDETNLETHGTWQLPGGNNKNTAIPGDDEQWLPALLDRANSMLQRDKNHSSIIMWSCGNESFGGKDLYDMSEFFRKNDNTRYVHYEGVANDRSYNNTSDVESRMYLRPDGIKKYLESNPEKPFISCEYMHAMGNSLGGMKLYTELEDEYPMFQGGFIWDYLDQAIKLTKENKGYVENNTFPYEQYGYGGDFLERPNDNNFCCDGIMYADRTYSPKMQEVKFLYQPVSIYPQRDSVTVHNRNLFTYTGMFEFKLTLYKNGISVYTQNLVINTAPLSKETVAIQLPIVYDGSEYTIHVAMNLSEDTIWEKQGFEIAFGEITFCAIKDEDKNDTVIDKYVPTLKSVNYAAMDKLEVVNGYSNIGVYGENFEFLFSKEAGTIISLKYDDKEYMYNKASLTYSRALTDNDRGARFGINNGIWRYVEENTFAIKNEYVYDEKENTATVTFIYDTNLKYINNEDYKGGHSKVTYIVYPDGSLKVKADFNSIKNMPDMALFGLRFALSNKYDRFKFYGYGPDENYIDRNNGARLSIFESKVIDNLARYSAPQACGNRTGVRWIEVLDNNNSGLKFEASGKPFEFTVLNYTEKELENALHSYELPKATYTYVNLIAKQMGVGGDDSWGAPVHEQYRIKSDKMLSVEFIVSKCN